MPTASIRFTSDFLITGLQRYRQQHRDRRARSAIKWFLTAILAFLASVALWQGSVLIGLLFAAFSVLVLFAHHIDHWLARRGFRKSPWRDENITIELTETGFHARSPKQDTKLQWSAFTKVAHFRDGFLLFQGPKFFNWIPVSSLADPSQAAELNRLLRSKIQEHICPETHSAGYCQGCGYELTGNVSGVCPECGQAVTPSH